MEHGAVAARRGAAVTRALHGIAALVCLEAIGWWAVAVGSAWLGRPDQWLAGPVLLGIPMAGGVTAVAWGLVRVARSNRAGTVPGGRAWWLVLVGGAIASVPLTSMFIRLEGRGVGVPGWLVALHPAAFAVVAFLVLLHRWAAPRSRWAEAVVAASTLAVLVGLLVLVPVRHGYQVVERVSAAEATRAVDAHRTELLANVRRENPEQLAWVEESWRSLGPLVERVLRGEFIDEGVEFGGEKGWPRYVPLWSRRPLERTAYPLFPNTEVWVGHWIRWPLVFAAQALILACGGGAFTAVVRWRRRRRADAAG